MVNNFDRVRDLLDFSTPGMFYFVQVIKRRKDNPGLPRDMKRISEYYIDSLAGFNNLESHVKEEATLNNARVYMHLNRRDYAKVALRTSMTITNFLYEGQPKWAKSAYNSACGKTCNEKMKKWVVDVDTDDEVFLFNVYNTIHELQKTQKSKSQKEFSSIVPTKNGYHIICSPFRQDTFREKFPDIVVGRDMPTVLFIP